MSPLEKAINGGLLSEREMITVMDMIMDGEVTEESMKSFLRSLAARGETTEEITGAARVLRAKAHGIKAPEGAVDCCGTGGDRSGTYNISSAVAFVAAACGVPMAKHGNRASSSKSGAADVLEALGINLDTPQDILEKALHDLGYAFLMAPRHHSAVRHVAAVRKKIGARTLFNLLGPLANPAGTQRQLIGVFDRCWLVPFAETLRNLGTQRAWIVHGSDGLDEITITGETYIAALDEDGHITERTLTPQDFGLRTHKPEDLTGGDAVENARALKALLNGQSGAYRDIVLANTAAVLCIHGSAQDLLDGVKQAAYAIDSGKALDVLEAYITLTNANTP